MVEFTHEIETFSCKIKILDSISSKEQKLVTNKLKFYLAMISGFKVRGGME